MLEKSQKKADNIIQMETSDKRPADVKAVYGPDPYHVRSGEKHYRLTMLNRDGRRESRGFPSEAEALRHKKAVEGKIIKTVYQLLKIYAEHLMADGKKESTVAAICRRVAMFFPRNTPLASISTKRLEKRYIKRTAGISCATSARELNELKAFADWAKANKYVRANFARSIKSK